MIMRNSKFVLPPLAKYKGGSCTLKVYLEIYTIYDYEAINSLRLMTSLHSQGRQAQASTGKKGSLYEQPTCLPKKELY